MKYFMDTKGVLKKINEDILWYEENHPITHFTRIEELDGLSGVYKGTLTTLKTLKKQLTHAIEFEKKKIDKKVLPDLLALGIDERASYELIEGIKRRLYE